MKEELRIVIESKQFIEKIVECSILFPKREYVFKNKIIETSFQFLEDFYLYNYKKEEIENLFKDLAMLNYYVEYAYKKRILSHKLNKEFSNQLIILLKLTYGLKRKYVS